MSKLNWEKITNTSGPQPRPRHGHRAVAIKDLMVVFGGGNEGIVDEIHVFNTATKQWFVPSTKGDIPPGCAAYGLVVDGTRLFAFGGMVEYGKYSNDLYELQASKWNWKKIKHYSNKSRTVPCPRLGHSFTIIKKQIYLFGGLSNESDDPKRNVPKYLNDLHVLDIPHKYVNDDGREVNVRDYSWSTPLIDNQGPSARESHTGVSFYDQRHHAWMLVIYGGMSGFRLGDLWFFNTETTAWMRPEISGTSPLPRSLHTATVINNKMFIFGGWVPIASTISNIIDICPEKEWRCTNTLAALDFNTMTWETISQESNDESVPKARAGHSAVGIHSKLIIWSGRDGYRKAWNNQVCCKDLWSIELAPPSIPGKVTLLKASSSTLEVSWLPSPAACYYVLQIQKYKTPSHPFAKNNKYNAARKSIGSFGVVSDSNRFKKPLDINVSHNKSPSPMYTIIKQDAAAAEPQSPTVQVRTVKSITPNMKVINTSGSGGGNVESSSPNTNFVRVITNPGGSAILKAIPQPPTANKTVTMGRNGNYIIRGNVQIAPRTQAQTQPQVYVISNNTLKPHTTTTTAPTVASPSTINSPTIQGNQNVKMVVLNPNAQNVTVKPDTPKPLTRQVIIGGKQVTVQMASSQTKSAINNLTTIDPSKLISNTIRKPVDSRPNLDSTKIIVLKKAQDVHNINGLQTVTMLDENNLNGGDKGLKGGSLSHVSKLSLLKNSQGIVSNFGLRGGGSENNSVSEQDNSSDGDGLSTLATAALGYAQPSVNLKKEVSDSDDKGDDTWYTVGVISGSSTEVSNYFYFDVENFDWDIKNLPDFSLLPKFHLEAGNAYKFRVAALNSYSLSGWTQTSAFKTCVPGFPGAPSCIKVAKAHDGAYLSWDPPPTPANEKLEYSVYLAVSATKSEAVANTAANPPLAFVRVYCGPVNQCFVGNNSLSIAYIDTTNKPAIIFRIAAKNEKGFGPATQVRWLQTGF